LLEPRIRGAFFAPISLDFAYNPASYPAPVMRWGAKPSRSIFQDLPDFHQRAGACLNRFRDLSSRLAAPKRRPKPFVLHTPDALGAPVQRSFFVSSL